MQRIGGRLRRMEREVWQKAREESAAEVARQIGRVLPVLLCARIPGNGWAAACTAPMCAVQILSGGFFPLIAIAGGMARLIFGMWAGEAFVLPDAISILLASGIGLWLRMRTQKREGLPILLLCCAVFFPRTFAVHLSLADWIRLLLQVGLAVCAFPVFRMAAGVFREEKKRTLLSEEELAALFLTAAVLLLGGIGIRILGISPALILLFAAVMTAAFTFGAGLGCACAAVMGLAAAAALSGEWLMIGNLVLCALICTMFHSLGKFPAAAAFLLTNAALTLLINGSSTVILDLKETLPAAGLFLLIPTERVRERVRTASLRIQTEEPDAALVQLRAHLLERLGQTAALFDGMSAAVRMPREEEAEDAFIGQTVEQLQQEVCAKCGLWSICWKREAAFTQRSFERALAEAHARGRLEPRRMEPVFARRCMKTASVIDGVNRAAALHLSEEKWREVFAGQRELLARQLTDTAKNLREWIRESEKETEKDAETVRRLRIALDRIGVHSPIYVHGQEIRVTEAPQKKHLIIHAAAEGVLHHSLAQREAAGELCLFPAPRYRVEIGIAQHAAEDENGDTVLSDCISPDRHLLILSDGMGRGAAARAESRTAAELLRSFLSFGVTEEDALERTNRLLLLRSGTEAFTTMDLCLFNLNEGDLSWTRVAAASGILITDGAPQWIRTEALPMGIAEQASPERLTFRLKAGDGVILLSDGVTDILGEEVLFSILLPMLAEPHDAQTLADGILHAAQSCAEGECDDMSVAVMYIKAEC